MNDHLQPTGPLLQSPPRAATSRFTFSSGDRPLEGYTIKRGIGRGGFGEVYYAVSDGGKEVALKLVQRNLDVELRGVSHCLNLKHLNLVALYDVKQSDNGDYWVVMEYVAGESLADALDRHPQGLPAEQVDQWLRGICAGVGYLHDRGIVHRDLKPANIFIEEGVVKIGDYGLSKFITASRRSGQTESVGTVHYMAPEIANGRYGKEIDIYAAGIIAYEMLTGQVPFEGESVGEILLKHLTAMPNVDTVPEKYRALVARTLAKDPLQRCQHISELLLDGGARAAASAPLPPPVGAPPPLPLGASPQRPQPHEVIALPFQIRDMYGGFAQAGGIARLDGDTLHLEFQVKDHFTGMVKSRIREIKLPLSEIASSRLDHYWWHSLLSIRVSHLSLLSDLPAKAIGELNLYIARNDRDVADRFAARLGIRAGAGVGSPGWTGVRMAGIAIPPAALGIWAEFLREDPLVGWLRRHGQRVQNWLSPNQPFHVVLFASVLFTTPLLPVLLPIAAAYTGTALLMRWFRGPSHSPVPPETATQLASAAVAPMHTTAPPMLVGEPVPASAAVARPSSSEREAMRAQARALARRSAGHVFWIVMMVWGGVVAPVVAIEHLLHISEWVAFGATGLVLGWVSSAICYVIASRRKYRKLQGAWPAAEKGFAFASNTPKTARRKVTELAGSMALTVPVIAAASVMLSTVMPMPQSDAPWRWWQRNQRELRWTTLGSPLRCALAPTCPEKPSSMIVVQHPHLRETTYVCVTHLPRERSRVRGDASSYQVVDLVTGNVVLERLASGHYIGRDDVKTRRWETTISVGPSGDDAPVTRSDEP